MLKLVCTASFSKPVNYGNIISILPFFKSTTNDIAIVIIVYNEFTKSIINITIIYYIYDTIMLNHIKLGFQGQ